MLNPQIKSALLKNFNEAIISNIPKIPLNLAFHFPFLGSLSKIIGNIDKRVNGMENASPYPNIPTSGKNHSPLEAVTNILPTKGIVHVNVAIEIINPFIKIEKYG